MRSIRESSLHEYAAWYLQREARKGRAEPVPQDPDEQVKLMWKGHNGKMRRWFAQGARWQVVSLDSLTEFSNLLFLECKWTKSEGLVTPDGTPNYRLLQRVAHNAIAVDYLDRPSAHRHKAYYDDLRTGHLQLRGDSRIAICSAEESEQRSNPAGRYYLLDGLGRSLPYMILVTKKELDYVPVEAFLVERPSLSQDERSGRWVTLQSEDIGDTCFRTSRPL